MMARNSRRFWLTLNIESTRRPLIYEMSREFPDIVFNIRNASVSPTAGLIGLELEGETERIDEVITWLESQSVQVEPIEINTIEG